MKFTLDTSGAVYLPTVVPHTQRFNAHIGPDRAVRWSDLDPFTQGYVEALFASVSEPERYVGSPEIGYYVERGAAFSDLSPEAVEMIRKDCAARLRHCPSEGTIPGLLRGERPDAFLKDNGSRFWRWRQAGRCKNFPPITVSLNDAGKVVLS